MRRNEWMEHRKFRSFKIIILQCETGATDKEGTVCTPYNCLCPAFTDLNASQLHRTDNRHLHSSTCRFRNTLQFFALHWTFLTSTVCCLHSFSPEYTWDENKADTLKLKLTLVKALRLDCICLTVSCCGQKCPNKHTGVCKCFGAPVLLKIS